MKIEDKIRNKVLEFARKNYCQYPEYILIHPQNYQELITDLANYSGVSGQLHNFKFMGAKVIQSMDIEKDNMLYESIICASQKLKS